MARNVHLGDMAWFFRHDSCSKELRQLSDRLDTAEGQLRLLRSEWVEQLDKFQHLVERFVKRVERSERRTAGSDNGNGATQGSGADPISERILQRRAHGIRSVVQPRVE